MKRIVAIIRQEKFEDVKKALVDVGCEGIELPDRSIPVYDPAQAVAKCADAFIRIFYLFFGREIDRRTVLEFYTFCLENYATRKRLSGMQAWVLFKETGADEYVIDNYDLLHTQGMDYILDDIQRFINRRRK